MAKQTIIRILTWLGILCGLTLLTMVVWVMVSGGSQTRSPLMWLQTAQSIATFVLPPILCALLWYKGQWKEWLHLSSPSTKWSYGALCALLMIIALPGLNLLSQLNQQITFPESLAGLETKLRAMEEAALSVTEQFVRTENAGQFMATLFVVAFLPAFGEELTFRALLINFFKGNNSKLKIAIWVSAILFSAVHMQFFGFFPRMLLGALFGYMLAWSGSLWLPIVMHLTNNALAVIVYNVMYWNGLDSTGADTFGYGDTLWVGILSLILTGVGIFFLRKMLLKNK
ncbi:MAG: CPBP family intramembrane metalloprotease [Paludibacteraceae bacterium]|nr:CPBP family intramembrane metalloprotease [Paludibacteraceae bacterium]